MSRYQPCIAYQAVGDTIGCAIRGGWADIYRLPDLGFEMMLAALKEAHCFVFDFAEVEATGDTTALGQFTADCITSGIFQPPFDATLMQWPDPPGGHWRYAAALAITLRRKGVPTKWGARFPGMDSKTSQKAQDEGCTVAAFGFGIDPTKLDDGFAMRNAQRAFLQDLSLIISFESGKRLDVQGYDPKADHEPWPLDHVMALNIFDRRLKEMSDSLVRDAGVTTRNIFYYMGILSSRGPVSRSMVPEPKIVAKRAREGRTPWVSYSLISLPHQSAAGPTGGTSEHRSSPRQHWRRGHIRRLPTGVITTVVPCMVGVSEMGKVIASYHVGKDALA